MSAYVNDILEQPDALVRTLQGLESFKGNSLADQFPLRRYRRLILTGMGSSLAVLYPLWISLVRSGLNPLLIETGELLLGVSDLLVEGTLVIVVSQSGESIEAVRLLERSQSATIVAVTNESGSALANQSDLVFLMHAGPEYSGASKTYVSSLAVLHMLPAFLLDPAGIELMFRDLYSVAEKMRQFLSKFSDLARESAKLLNERSIIICGRGSSLAACEGGALILKEAAKIHAEALSIPQFRHGPIELCATGINLLVYQTSDPFKDSCERLLAEAKNAGANAIKIGPESDTEAFRLPAVEPSLWQFMEIIPMQLLSVGLAWKNGRAPGEFLVGQKVTTTD